VVVANIQMRHITLKTEVRKGSMSTVIEHGSIDPKGDVNVNKLGNLNFCFFPYPERENG